MFGATETIQNAAPRNYEGYNLDFIYLLFFFSFSNVICRLSGLRAQIQDTFT